MSIGFKIKRLREEKNISQPSLAEILKISQSELSKIESGKTQKIDYLFMNKVCEFFEKDHAFFDENVSQTNHIKKMENSVNYNYGTFNLNQESIIDEIKNLFAENQSLKAENLELKAKVEKS
jgi:transcriptional regulator with XRE-family HTH domain